MSLSDNTTKIASVLAKVNALPAQLDTSDATAAAEDIVQGKTAYVNGEKVTGSRKKVTQLTGSVTNKGILNGLVTLVGKVKQNAAIDAGKTIGLSLGTEELGNANDADVAKGKTYTSASGFKRTGTHEEAAAPSGSISITANGTYDVTDKASAVVNVPTSVTQESCVTDLGLLTFGHEVKTITVNGTAHEYVEYTSNTFSVPASLASFEGEFRYSICIPFEFPYRLSTLEYDCVETGFLYIWFSADPTVGSLVTTGSITMGANIFTLMPMDSFPAESMPEGTTWFINCVKLINLDEEGTNYKIRFTLSTQDTEGLGILAPPNLVSGTNYLTTHLENVRGLLITYEEETGT